MLSAVILTKNEEENIGACIKSLVWCDEIIVVDDESEDKTVAIAKKLGATVYEHALGNDFAKQRNFGLEKAKGDWILFIDADERITDSLAYEVTTMLHRGDDISKNYSAYSLLRIDTMWSRKFLHGETGNMRIVRLVKKELGGTWQGLVHETWKTKGATHVGQLKNPLQHFPHPTVAAFLSEINFYTTIRANELYKKGIKTPWWSIILYPKAKFLQNYFVKLGFLDGTPGFVSAMLMSFHSFLVRGKLWLLWNKK